MWEKRGWARAVASEQHTSQLSQGVLVARHVDRPWQVAWVHVAPPVILLYFRLERQTERSRDTQKGEGSVLFPTRPAISWRVSIPGSLSSKTAVSLCSKSHISKGTHIFVFFFFQKAGLLSVINNVAQFYRFVWCTFILPLNHQSFIKLTTSRWYCATAVILLSVFAAFWNKRKNKHAVLINCAACF